MSQPSLPQPAAAVRMLAPTPTFEADAIAYQRAAVWLDAHRGDDIPRKMQWSECQPSEWPDDATRPLRYWLLTAHTKQAMYAITVALHANGTYTVNGEMTEARA